MINIIFELSFVNDMVDFFAYTLNTTISTNLTYDILIVLALSELKSLVNWFRTIGNDVFKFQRTKMRPLLLYSLQCNTWCLIINRTVSQLAIAIICLQIWGHVSTTILWFIFIILIFLILGYITRWLDLLLGHGYLLCSDLVLILLQNLHLMI